MRLGVNVDHIATLRQARKIDLISPVEAARICEAAGAEAIVAHLREDRRHIQDKDVFDLKKAISSRLNLEMSINEDIIDVALRLKPDTSTLVPEKRQELTTEGGLDILTNKHKVKEALKRLKSSGISVSLFVDPTKSQILAASDVGADIVELHTGRYAQEKNKTKRQRLLEELRRCAIFARENGLRVAAGHGLDYENTREVAAIKEIEELNIGYSIICQAVFVGLKQAVIQMRALMDRS